MGLTAQCMDPNEDGAMFLYCPSIPAALLFSITFGLITLTHLIQAIVYRKKFCWVIIMGGLWETCGFVFRVLAIQHQREEKLAQGYGIPSQLLILLSPLWVNAFSYVLFGRMVFFFLPEGKIMRIPAQRLAMIFVILDIIAFAIQVVGGMMASSTGSSTDTSKVIKTGLNIYMGGLGIQEFFMVLFTFMAIKLHHHLLAMSFLKPGWKKMIYCLYSVLTLITIRIIYRLIEFSQGIISKITTHEAYFYVFEGLPMMLAFLILAIWHPGTVLVGPESHFPKKPKEEKKKKEKKDKKGKKGEQIPIELNANASSPTSLIKGSDSLV